VIALSNFKLESLNETECRRLCTSPELKIIGPDRFQYGFV
jgi:hypothetical protein